MAHAKLQVLSHEGTKELDVPANVSRLRAVDSSEPVVWCSSALLLPALGQELISATGSLPNSRCRRE